VRLATARHAARQTRRPFLVASYVCDWPPPRTPPLPGRPLPGRSPPGRRAPPRVLTAQPTEKLTTACALGAHGLQPTHDPPLLLLTLLCRPLLSACSSVPSSLFVSHQHPLPCPRRSCSSAFRPRTPGGKTANQRACSCVRCGASFRF